MCGIAGTVGVATPRLDEMAACIKHRGPDGFGSHEDDHVSLANRRLSIIDIDGGDQPIYNEDGDVVVVYNGEIYNHASLHKDLTAAGHRFTTDTDTEVLVHGYEEWGTDLFARLNGMFTFALWDATAERLLLARDRAGIKPLYVCRTDGGLAFASEPKSILRGGHVEPVVDTDALAYFLQLRYTPSHTTLFEGIDTVLPGEFVDVRREDGDWAVSREQFWTLADVPREPPADPVAAVERALERAVDRQLMSDVPVGFYLSGGLDTSSVVAMAAERSDEPISTFCMGFEDARWDERPDARAVADHFGTDHHELTLESRYMDDFPAMIWAADEPKRNLYPYYVQRAMSEHVTVALGGLGADELFGGYVYRYDRLRDLESLRECLSPASRDGWRESADRIATHQRAHGGLEHDDVLEEVDSLRHLEDDPRLYVLLNSTDVLGDTALYEDRVFGVALDGATDPATLVEHRLPETFQAESLRDRALAWDFSVKLPDDFLLVEDRTSMAHSLESRVPFLDNELIDLAFTLPLDSKFGDGSDRRPVGKQVLREAMRDRLPETVFEKDKQGFTMPTFPFVRDEMLDHARAILDDPHVVREGFVRERYLHKLLNTGPRRELTPHYKLLWKVLALEIWYQMYVVHDVAGPDPLESYYA
jgi:asparagine synthase (glutamine-hydrolysing)